MVIASRALVAAGLLAAALWGAPAVAQEALPVTNGPADVGTQPAPPDRPSLDALARDLGLSLLAKPGETSVRVPLAPRDWSFLKGIEPYATLSPSAVKPILDASTGLAAPDRDFAEDQWKGLGVGAGVRWRLSDRLDLFGQYLFTTLPGAHEPTASPVIRRDSESPGVKGGFSIHF